MSNNTRATNYLDNTVSMAKFFRDIEPEVKDFILNATAPLNLKKDQRLFERGDPGGVMYVLLDGRIEISMITEVGRKISLNLIDAGNCFGEISMLDHHKRTASAVAVEDSRLQPIHYETFIAAAKRSQVLALTLIEILCERVRWVSDSVEEYALLSLERRLARRLLVLNQRFASDDGSINIAQSDLADFAGSSRESTNKVLMHWKSLGLISIGRRALVLLDHVRLEHIAYESADPH
jgi:CRP/FNR family transcriptional regulator, cyclic AMP receptor protein